MYRNPAVRTPQLNELTELSKSLNLDCCQEELENMKGHMEEMFSAYQIVNDLVAPSLPVRYPRTTGYRPEPADNKWNAWYWKCDIRGAAEGLLKGKRIAIKDSMCVAGVPMTNGSILMNGYTPDIDATVVTRILDAGGHIIGKTNCEHMCFSGSSWSNDAGPTPNPYDANRSSGGSSSGSAVAICKGEVDMAIGGDNGGSIRIPSAWCGIVGLKPTWGLVPYTGAVPLDVTMDHVGPMANTVKDCALLLEAIAGYDDGRDPRQTCDIKVPQYSKLMDTNVIRGMKIGLVTEGFEECDKDVNSIVRDAAQKLTAMGAKIEDVSIPLHKFGKAIWTPIAISGTYQCMVKGNGAGYFYKGYYPESLMEKLAGGFATKTRNMSDTMKMLFLAGEYMEKNYGNRFYGRAQNLNMKLTSAYNRALEECDVLVMPTLPYKAPLLPENDSTVKERLENALGMIKNTATFNITGHPALSINAGNSEGLPVGLMIVGKHFEETTVLNVAYAIENC